MSVYRDRLAPGTNPPIDMRTMTAYRPQGVEFHDAIPTTPSSPHVSWRLLLGMGGDGRAPEIGHMWMSSMADMPEKSKC
ncbi:MAG: hypothetical protein H6892_02500 [Brucellaceae bacterium]|nr:hypothetical protein [Brucellaceae bacterium]